MTTYELINEVCRAGAVIYAEPPDIVIDPGDVVPSDLKAEIKKRRDEVLRCLELISNSRKRLEAAGISIAIFDDGSMRIVINEDETAKAIEAGGIVYSPADMYYFIQLDQRERQMLHSFKGQFGGSVEWTKASDGKES